MYDILGRKVSTLINDEKTAGSYTVGFSAKGGSISGGNAYDLPSGIISTRLRQRLSTGKQEVLFKLKRWY